MSSYQKFLEPNEAIERVLRRHWLALVGPLTKITLLGLIIPLFFAWLFTENKYILGVSVLWFLIGLIYLIYAVFDWLFDVMLLTNSSIVDINWKGVFKKTAKRLNYENIDNVEYEMTGLLSSLFKFGNLKIMTFSGDTRVLRKTRQVNEMQKLILNYKTLAEPTTPMRTENTKPIDSNIDLSTLKKAIKSVMDEEDDSEESSPPPETKQEIVIIEKRKIKTRPRKHG